MARKRTIYSPEYGVLLDMLRERRKATGYTQADIAKKMGMTPSAFAKYERGELRLDFVQVRDLVIALKLSFPRFTRDFERRV